MVDLEREMYIFLQSKPLELVSTLYQAGNLLQEFWDTMGWWQDRGLISEHDNGDQRTNLKWTVPNGNLLKINIDCVLEFSTGKATISSM